MHFIPDQYLHPARGFDIVANFECHCSSSFKYPLSIAHAKPMAIASALSSSNRPRSVYNKGLTSSPSRLITPAATSSFLALPLPPIYFLTRLATDRKSTRLNSSHVASSYAVFCLKKKTQ